MKLFYDPQTKWFMLICDCEDRRLPAAAGFVWNKLAQVWWTSDYVGAKRLIKYADESVSISFHDCSALYQKRTVVFRNRTPHNSSDLTKAYFLEI